MAKISAKKEYKEQNLLRSQLENVFEKRIERVLRQYVNLCAKELVENGDIDRVEAILEENIRKQFYHQYNRVIRTFAKRTFRKLLEKKNEEDQFETMVSKYIALYGARRL